jgi:hypothetical protein
MNSVAYPDITRVPEDKAKEIFKHAEFHSTPFNNEQLTRDQLEKADLIPRYEVPIHDGFVWFSDLFYLIENRIAVLCYIQPKGEPTVIRSYYRSKSQGVLRYLADYMIKDGVFDWYAKGHEHSHITACIAMQKAFAQIENDNMPKYVDRHDLLFAGTARERNPGEPPYHGTSGEPEPLNGNFYPKTEDRIHPEKLVFNDPQEAPDFSKKMESWTKKPQIYGKVHVDIFASKNGVYNYMFCKDSRNRAWIGMIEKTTGKFRSTGIIKPWIAAGDLITPAYEYPILSYGYGNENDKKGHYVDMFENYLSKVPVIQEYLHLAD